LLLVLAASRLDSEVAGDGDRRLLLEVDEARDEETAGAAGGAKL